MWLHRSGVVWIYLLLLLLNTNLSSVPHIPQLLLFPVHLYLLHKFTAPFLTNVKALTFLRSRFLLIVILAPFTIVIYPVWGTLQIPVKFLVFFSSKSANWASLIQSITRVNIKPLMFAVKNTLNEMSGISSYAGYIAYVTRHDQTLPGLAWTIKDATVRHMFYAIWTTAVAWLMTRGHLSMVITVSDGWVRMGKVQLNRVMAFTLVGALGMRIGVHMYILATTLRLSVKPWNPWWLGDVVQLTQQTMLLCRELISAGTFAISSALNEKVWWAVHPLLVLNVVGSATEHHMLFGWNWKNWPRLTALSVLVEVVVILLTGWRSFRRMGGRNRGSKSHCL